MWLIAATRQVEHGITVIGKRAVIPRGVRIGRNGADRGRSSRRDFSSRVVHSGSTVERPHERMVRSPSQARVPQMGAPRPRTDMRVQPRTTRPQPKAWA